MRANLNDRRIVSFGVIKGLIYRVHKYPILTSITNETEVAQSTCLPSNNEVVINKNTGMPIYPDIIPYLDGKHHYDEICTALECSPQELDEQLGYPPPDESTMDESIVEDTQWSVKFIFR